MDENIRNEESIEQSKEEQFYHSFNKIDNFFKSKEEYIKKYKHVPFDEILKNAPKFYAFINFVEKINILLSKNKGWLKILSRRIILSLILIFMKDGKPVKNLTKKIPDTKIRNARRSGFMFCRIIL